MICSSKISVFSSNDAGYLEKHGACKPTSWLGRNAHKVIKYGYGLPIVWVIVVLFERVVLCFQEYFRNSTKSYLQEAPPEILKEIFFYLESPEIIRLVSKQCKTIMDTIYPISLVEKELEPEKKRYSYRGFKSQHDVSLFLLYKALVTNQNHRVLILNGEEFLASKPQHLMARTLKSFREIEEWIRDENVIRMGKQIFKKELSGSHHDRAESIRSKMKEEAMRNRLTIQLDNLDLTEIPIEVCSLMKLKYLRVAFNQITSIPDSLSQIPTLITLNLSNNNLRHVPDNIGSLTNLQELYLWDNLIEHIPNSIASLSKLKILNLSNNIIVEIPEAISKLTCLQRLFLKGNKLRKIPETVRTMPNLLDLELEQQII